MRAASCLTVLLLLLCSGCGKTQRSRTNRDVDSRTARRQPAALLAGPGAALERAVRRVSLQCARLAAAKKWTGMDMSECGDELDWKPVKRACKDLRWEVTIGTLCRLAGDAKPAVRAVARVRLASVALESQVDAIPDFKKLLVPCYAQRLSDTTTVAEAQYWAPLLVALPPKWV